MSRIGALVLLATFAGACACHAQDAPPPMAADSGPSRAIEAPIDPRPAREKFWWSDAWFENGVIETPANHEVVQREVSYRNGADGIDIPALLFRPATPGRYPAVLFVHGRRGLDELVVRMPRRLAARGFVVLAPNAHAARFIEAMPIAHDPATERDFGAGLDFLLALPDVSTSRACLVSMSRGGYHTLMMAVAQRRQIEQAACYVSTYPHWQNPAAGEPDQVYRYAAEVERLEIPVLVMIGEFEQYQRRRAIEMGVAALKARGRDARLIIYPGVGRGFDFRPAGVRTFADDLAAKDALQRAAEFIARNLGDHVRR